MLHRLRTADPRLTTILLIVLVQMVGASLILPILPLYARSEFQMSPQAITPLISAFFAAQFLAAPFLGRLSDRHGRLPVLIVSQIGTAVSFALLGLAANAPTLFAARILDGITGGNILVAQAYITDITPRERRTEALGLVSAVFGLGFIFGPALGSVFAAWLGPRAPYLIAAVIAALLVVLTWRTLDETVTPERAAAAATEQRSAAWRTAVGNRPLQLVLLIGFIGQFGFGMLQSTFALYGEARIFAGYPERVVKLAIGLLLSVVGVTQFVTQAALLRPLLRKLGEARLISVGLLARALGMALFAWWGTPPAAALGGVLFALGMGVIMPPLQSLATLSVADDGRGAALGLFQSAASLAIIFSTALAGTFFSIAPPLPYWIGGALSLVALLPVLILVRRVAAN